MMNETSVPLLFATVKIINHLFFYLNHLETWELLLLYPRT